MTQTVCIPTTISKANARIEVQTHDHVLQDVAVHHPDSGLSHPQSPSCNRSVIVHPGVNSAYLSIRPMLLALSRCRIGTAWWCLV